MLKKNTLASRRSKYILKTLLLGDGGVGKTALVQRFITGHFKSNYILTVGIDISTKELHLANGRTVKLVINDLAGQPRFSDIRDTFYRNAALALLVFDCTRKASLTSLKKNWVPGFAQLNPPIPQRPKIQVILVANKTDLEDYRMVTEEEAQEVMTELQQTYDDRLEFIQYIETSAKENINVDEAFTLLAESYINKSPKS